MESSSSIEAFDTYISEIRQYPLLPPEQEYPLICRAADGDAEAQQLLVNHNLRFVVSLSLRIPRHEPLISLMDLIQEGNLGLIKASETVDPAKGERFCTYAAWWIKHYQSRYLLQQQRFGRLPTWIGRILRQMYRLEAQMATEGLSPSTADYLQKLPRLDHETLQQLLIIRSHPYYLHEELPGTSGITYLEMLEQSILFQRDATEQIEDTLFVEYLLSQIPSVRVRQILDLHLGLSGSPQTLEQIGQQFDISKSRVRQLVIRGLDTLREYLKVEAIEENYVS